MWTAPLITLLICCSSHHHTGFFKDTVKAHQQTLHGWKKPRSSQFISLYLHWEQIEVFKYLPQLLNQQRIYFKTKLLCRTLLYYPARTQFCSTGLQGGCPCSLTPHSSTLSPSLGSNSARQAHIGDQLSQTRRNGNITLCFLDKLKFHSWFFEKPGQQLLCSLYPAWLMDTDRCEQQTTVSLKRDGGSAVQSWSVQFLIHRQTESAERAALLPHLHLLSRRDQRSLRLNHNLFF